MDLSELDGFLAGLVAGPEIVPREDWLAEVWDNEEPDYLDEAEQESVEQAIFDRYAAIESGLSATPLGYTQFCGRTRPGLRWRRTGPRGSCRPSAFVPRPGNRRWRMRMPPCC